MIRKLIIKTFAKNMFPFVNDRVYLKIGYWAKMGKRLNLENPVTFNEKLQWLKLNDQKEYYTQMVDKYEVKKFVAQRIGEQYIIESFGVWDSFDEIDFNCLPDRFVLKCTHDSGGLVICKNRKELDVEKARRRIQECLQRDFYGVWREWPYKNVKHRVIAERYLEIEGGDLPDYKIHCFNGTPRFVLVCRNRFGKGGMTEDFFDLDWNHLEVSRPGHQFSKDVIEKPEELDQMVHLASILSKEIPFLRVDFYLVNHRIYFGELTFFPGSGVIPFVPERYDEQFGNWIVLPDKLRRE